MLTENEALSWRSNVNLERLLTLIETRTKLLVNRLNLPDQEFSNSVDLTYESIVLSETLDSAWLSGLYLYREYDLQKAAQAVVGKKVTDETRAVDEMRADESTLALKRKEYLDALATTRKQILKYKAKFEEASHHVNVFSTGMHCVNLKEGAEEMRCSFNELRRLNASLEERLVLAGISKQKIMTDLREELVEIRASCSQNPNHRGSHHQAIDEPLQDLNLSNQTLKDINEVWKASLPEVHALSDSDRHTEMLTFLSSSLGFFGAECIEDIADTYLSTQTGEADLEEERAKLFGVLSVETHRYRSISGALQASIKDSEFLLEPDRFSTVGAVISEAGRTAAQRLSCQVVFIWRIAHGTLTGFSSRSSDKLISIAISPDDHCSYATTRFTPSALDPGTGSDIRALVLAGQLATYKDEDHEALTVTWQDTGMTIVRSWKRDPPFHQFAGVYCEQFHRRVVSAIAPLQLVQIRRIADQRPLDLVDCLFDLRMSASSPNITAGLVARHLAKLFHARNVVVYIPIEAEQNGRAIKIDSSDTGEHADDDIERFCDLTDIDDRLRGTALNGVSIVSVPALQPNSLKSKASIISEDIDQHSQPNEEQQDDATRPSVLFPVFKGRQTIMLLEWTNPDPYSEGEGFDDVRIATETLFHESNPDHKSILTQYTGVLECILAQWFKPANSLIYQLNELTCYETETERENSLVMKIMKDTFYSR